MGVVGTLRRVATGPDRRPPPARSRRWATILLYGGPLGVLALAGLGLANAAHLLDHRELNQAVAGLLSAGSVLDVVAHHMSMIAVQAETAPYRIPGLPPPTLAEFSTIAAGRTGRAERHAAAARRAACGDRRVAGGAPAGACPMWPRLSRQPRGPRSR